MHKGDYHTDYGKFYDKEYKKRDTAFEHIKKLKLTQRNQNFTENQKQSEKKESM